MERATMIHKNADERRSDRANVLLVGTIESLGVRSRVRIGNVSSLGALVIAAAVPAEGSEILLRCNDVAIRGWVVWVKPLCAGICFDESIDLRALLPKKAAPHAITKDTRTVEFRRPGFRGNQLGNHERKIVEEWSRLPGFSRRA